jgi:ankyrin repeat/BTB/POZ domain-containing protein 1
MIRSHIWLAFSAQVCEGGPDNAPLAVALHRIEPSVFAAVHSYIYENDVKLGTLEQAVDLLVAADEYLLPGLKRLCGSSIASWLHLSNVCDVFKLSRLYQLPRLEHACCEFMAANLDSVCFADNTFFFCLL